MPDPLFFCFDGIDGAGKSTQIRLFRDWMQASGHDVLEVRDPGSTPLGEKVRDLLLSHSDTPIGVRAEMLLYMAARAQLVEEQIRPALAANKTILSDRYLLANVVYQGHAGGLDLDDLWRIGQVATGGLMPDLTFVLDLPVNMAAGRRDHEPDRIERRGGAFLNRVREGFLREARRQPGIKVIDATHAAAEVQTEIQGAAQSFLETRSPS